MTTLFAEQPRQQQVSWNYIRTDKDILVRTYLNTLRAWTCSVNRPKIWCENLRNFQSSRLYSYLLSPPVVPDVRLNLHNTGVNKPPDPNCRPNLALCPVAVRGEHVQLDSQDGVAFLIAKLVDITKSPEKSVHPGEGARSGRESTGESVKTEAMWHGEQNKRCSGRRISTDVTLLSPSASMACWSLAWLSFSLHQTESTLTSRSESPGVEIRAETLTTLHYTTAVYCISSFHLKRELRLYYAIRRKDGLLVVACRLDLLSCQVDLVVVHY